MEANVNSNEMCKDGVRCGNKDACKFAHQIVDLRPSEEGKK